MKKLILALSLGLLLPLSACGSNSGNGGQDTVFSKFDGKLENGAVLRILENDTAVKQGYLKELIAGFNEKNIKNITLLLSMPIWMSILTWKMTDHMDMDQMFYTKQTTL